MTELGQCPSLTVVVSLCNKTKLSLTHLKNAHSCEQSYLFEYIKGGVLSKIEMNIQKT